MARIRVDGREIDPVDIPLDASLVETEPGVYSVLWNGLSFEVRTSGNTYQVNGVAFEVDVEDPRDASRTGAHGSGSGQQLINAPMPGRIVRVLVETGVEVEAGQGIVVIEAMKMQNEMKAARPGIVSSISAVAGNTVAAGELLAVID